MKLGLLLVALACLGAACAQFPPLPASCVGTVSSFTALLGAQTEIDAACPKGATSCSEACKAALAKVRRRWPRRRRGDEWSDCRRLPGACLAERPDQFATLHAIAVCLQERRARGLPAGRPQAEPHHHRGPDHGTRDGVSRTAQPARGTLVHPFNFPLDVGLPLIGTVCSNPCCSFKACGLTATASPSPSPQPSPSPSPAPKSLSPSPSPTAQPQPSPSPVAQPSPSPSPNPSPIAQPQPSPSPAAQPSPSPSPSPSPIPDVPTLVPWEAVAVGAPPSAAAPAPAPAVAKELTAAPAPAPEVAAFDDAGKAPALSTGAQPATQGARRVGEAQR